MSPADFRAAGLILFGGEYRRPMRELLQVSDRNLSRFVSGDKSVGDEFESILLQAIRDQYNLEPTPIMCVLMRALEPTDD